MSDTTISPNMNMPIPVVGTDPGPDWANNLNASLNIVDSHNHSTGQGVQINPDGIDININLDFNGNDATTVRSVNFSAQSAPLSEPSDVGCIYESGVDLYYNDGNANQIRITQSGSVTGASGTITGLPSGTASASFAAGTFSFQSATNTPAQMAVGPLIIGRNTALSKTVTIQPNSSQASDFSMALPIALPASNAFLTCDNSGNMGTVLYTDSANTYIPTISGWASGISVNTINPFSYIKIGNIVSVSGSFLLNFSGGTASLTLTITNPISSGVISGAGLFQQIYLGTSVYLSPSIALSVGPYVNILTATHGLTQTGVTFAASWMYSLS